MKQQKQQNNPNTDLELALLKKGYKYIYGIDEAGRGSWAGPVSVGAYRFDLETKVLEGVKDSKLIIPQKRNVLYKQLYKVENSIIEFGEVDLINSIGIGNTITTLIDKIIKATYSDDTFYLIDGIFSKDFGKNSRKVIKGDLLHYSISCASILAKVKRDSLMKELAIEFPEYGFDLHKGYGTKKHQQALNNYGISKIHRINYKPIALFNDANQRGKTK